MLEETMTNQATTAKRQAVSDRSLAALIQRWIVTLHMAALAAQVVLALLLLGGGVSAIQLHFTHSWVVLALGALQAIVVIPTWPTGGSFWKVAAALVPLAEATQIYLGRTGNLSAHVTLGTVLWGLSLAILIQVWAPSWGRQLPSAT
jgi:hypothetical protein